ncbi:MAG TPA: universal stress protein [Micromonosporaceae bacterium]|nr:universal stress protein [Micromonosporaceae bacterium]
MVISRPVVVGIDGSVTSHGALAYAAWEADRRNCPLRLVNSYSLSVPYAIMGFTPDPNEFNRATQAARAMLDDYRSKVLAAYPRVTVETSVVAGSAGGALVDASVDASLVVVGSRGLGGFAGLMLGSVGTQLAAHSRAPVVIVRPPGEAGELGSPPAPKPVVVGIDGVPDSDAALAFAFDQASARKAPLTALYAWWMLPVSELGPAAISAREEALAEAEEEARLLLAEATAGWRADYPDVEVNLMPARALNPTVALLDASRDAGLLVVSRHGGNALTRLVFGSVGDIAVREAPCPVAVVPERTA